MKKSKGDRQLTQEVMVRVSDRVSRLIAVECAATEGETGGMLLGHLRTSRDCLEYEATHATPPGPDSVCGPTNFTRDSEFADCRLRYLANKFGVRYLGEWHKHPVADAPTASPKDRRTMRAIARKPAYDIDFPILIIANEDGDTMTVYVSDNRRVDRVRVLNTVGRTGPALRHGPANEDNASR